MTYRSVTALDEPEFALPLPEGRYAVQARVITYDGERNARATDYFAEPEVVLGSDRTLELDARRARPLRPLVVDEDRALEDGSLSVDLVRTRADGLGIGTDDLATLGDRDTAFGVIPSATTAEHGAFHLAADHQLRDPYLTGSWTAGGRTTPLPLLSPVQAPRSDSSLRLPAVSVGAGADSDYAGRDVTGKLVVVSTTRAVVSPLVATAEAHGAAAVLVTRPTPGTTVIQGAASAEVPVVAAPHEAGRVLLAALADQPVTVALDNRRDSRFTYTVPMDFAGAIPESPVLTTRKDDYATLVNDFHAGGADRPTT
ncbi:PA domain-containing protein [Streptomyces sp. NPDC035033]|uniref:PA domain-containing protein n=1 Tax=Streptomyces sp. NPDC035033 TaxID=3155368 RepID=UPI0033CC6A4E